MEFFQVSINEGIMSMTDQEFNAEIESSVMRLVNRGLVSDKIVPYIATSRATRGRGFLSCPIALRCMRELRIQPRSIASWIINDLKGKGVPAVMTGPGFICLPL